MSAIPVIDEVDRQIIAILCEDGRASFVAIAHTVGLSKDAVRARVTRLTDEGVLQITALVHPSSLGLSTRGAVALSYAGNMSDLIDRLRDQTAITFVAQMIGTINVLCEVSSRDYETFAEVISADIATIPGVTVHGVWCHLQVIKWDSQVRPRHASADRRVRPPRDELDITLLRHIVADPRANYRELEARTGEPYSVVRRRTQNLFDDGVVQANAIVNSLSIQNEFRGHVALRLRGDWDAALDTISRIPEVRILTNTSGPDNATAEIACADGEEFAVVLRRIAMVPGVTGVASYPFSRLLVLPKPWRFD